MTHYDDDYWRFQRPIGQAGGRLDRFKFEPYVQASDVVLDFGCGGGFLLAALECRSRIGVEASEAARHHAAALGIAVHARTGDVSTGAVDVVISNHALEHVERPLDVLRDLRRVLRPSGTLVLCVPIDDWRMQRRPDPHDPNHHLYTWTPLLLAHLIRDAGFDLKHCRVLTHAWRPSFAALQPRVPRLTAALARALAVARRRRQILAVARSPVRSVS